MGLVFVVGGCLMAIGALIAKHALNEVDYPVSKEELEKYAPPTSWHRSFGVSVGILCVAFGIFSFFFRH